MNVPELRRAAKRIRDREKPDLDAAKRLLEKASHGGGQADVAIASLVFMPHRGKLGEDDWPDVARWAQGVEAPEAADLFAQYVARPLYVEAPGKEVVERWARSAEPLLRRLAARTAAMDVAALLAKDEDPLVQEAVVDALRERAKDDEDEVFRFLREHKGAAHAIVRGAAAALSPGNALALTTGRLPPAKKRKAKRAAPKRGADERARRARERAAARKERERAERELKEAEAALSRARKRYDAARR